MSWATLKLGQKPLQLCNYGRKISHKYYDRKYWAIVNKIQKNQFKIAFNDLSELLLKSYKKEMEKKIIHLEVQ